MTIQSPYVKVFDANANLITRSQVVKMLEPIPEQRSFEAIGYMLVFEVTVEALSRNNYFIQPAEKVHCLDNEDFPCAEISDYINLSQESSTKEVITLENEAISVDLRPGNILSYIESKEFDQKTRIASFIYTYNT